MSEFKSTPDTADRKIRELKDGSPAITRNAAKTGEGQETGKGCWRAECGRLTVSGFPEGAGAENGPEGPPEERAAQVRLEARSPWKGWGVTGVWLSHIGLIMKQEVKSDMADT